MVAARACMVGLGLLVRVSYTDAVACEGPDSGPWNGVASTIPGAIQAEEYDCGGQDVAYNDSTSGNSWDVFRTDEDVDVISRHGGYMVADIEVGEYLRYTVDLLSKVETFDFTFQVAAERDRPDAFRVVSGGAGCGDYTTDLSGLVTVPSTGSYETYENRFISGPCSGGLAAGTSYIWLCMTSNDFDIDYFTMLETSVKPPGGGPYNGVAAVIPGTIQAEAFDYGGQGTGYYDTSVGNEWDVFRTDEDVDVLTRNGGYMIGFIRVGEYLRYTVDLSINVEAFDFTFRVAAIENRVDAFHVVSGGTGCGDYTTDLSGLVTVTSTGSFEAYEDRFISGPCSGGLPAGSSLIWLCVLSHDFDLDYFTMSETQTPVKRLVGGVGGPYNGVAATVPGTIQAEEFDVGGEGVGYSDSTAGNAGDVFRPDDDVDIRALDDGYGIGYISAGEYLRYTVNVEEDVDEFLFSFRVASSNGLGSFRIVSGGNGCDDFTTDLSGLIAVPSTGGNNRYKTFSVSGHGNGGLRAGDTKIWLCALSRAFNIDSITMSKTTTC